MASTSPFGEHLKREREMRGVSLAEVSAATRISTRFLEAIESGQWEHLPGGAFNRGFIRSASRYLGLNEESMVAEYALETSGNGTTYAAPKTATELPRDWRPIAAIAAILVALIAIVAGGWFVTSKILTRARAHSAAPVSGSTSSAQSAATASPTALPLRLAIQSSASVQIEVVADGSSVFRDRMGANQTREFSARDFLRVSSTDAGAVRLELNGQPLPTMGSAGQPGQVTLTAKDLKSSAGGVH